MTTLWIVVGVVGYLLVGCVLARVIQADEQGDDMPLVFAFVWGFLFVIVAAGAVLALLLYPIHRLAGGKPLP